MTRPLTEVICSTARTESAYPDGSNPPDERDVLAWVRGSLPRSALGLPRKAPGLLLTAAWPDREANWFPKVVGALLEQWTELDATLRSGTRMGRAAAEWLAAGAVGRSHAGRHVLLAQGLEKEMRRLEVLLRQERGERERSRSGEGALEARLHEAQGRISEMEQREASTKSHIELLERRLASTRVEADRERAHVLTQTGNEIGRLRERVIRVVGLEARQIRAYLERPSPEPAAALERLGIIERLLYELEASE